MEKQTPVVDQGKRSGKKKIIIGLVILFIAIALFLGINLYVSWSGLASENYIANAPRYTPTQTSPTPDPTANWKTYSSEKYGYSLKYPYDWKEEIKCRGGLPNDDYICLKSPDFTESAAPNTESGGIIIIENNKNGSYKIVDTIETFCNRPQVSKCDDIEVGGLKAISRELSGWNNKAVGIIRDGNIDMSITAEFAPANKDRILNSFNQILSTFKFTKSNNLVGSGKYEGFPVYPGAKLLDKSTSGSKANRPYSTTDYRYVSNDDFDSINNWYKKDNGSGWICEGGAGQYLNSRSASGITFCNKKIKIEPPVAVFVDATDKSSQITIQIPN